MKKVMVTVVDSAFLSIGNVATGWYFKHVQI